MNGPMRRVACFAAAVGVLALHGPGASGRPVRLWTIQALAEKADVLAVAEVLGTASVGPIDPDQNRWRIALVQMHAKLRVLRTFPPDAAAPKPGQVITLQYRAVARGDAQGICNGPLFPELHKGEVFVFPLRRIAAGQTAVWELIDEEDHNLLVAAASQALGGVETNTSVQFLRAELAGAFAKGRYADMFRGARYFAYQHEARTVGALLRLIERHTGKDERRWLDVATASYCALPLQRPTVAELLKATPKREPREALAALAFRHVRRDGLDGRFIANALRHAALHQWGTAIALKLNYPRHPAAMKLLAAALDADTPEALYIASMLVRGSDHPVAASAARAATRALARRPPLGFGHLRAACELIRDYGNDKAFAVLLGHIKTAQRADRKRYRMLWQSCAYSDGDRMLAICRIVLDDRGPFSPNRRFCDIAASEVQRATRVPFGFSLDLSPAQRDEAIQRIRNWLDKHFPGLKR